MCIYRRYGVIYFALIMRPLNLVFFTACLNKSNVLYSQRKTVLQLTFLNSRCAVMVPHLLLLLLLFLLLHFLVLLLLLVTDLLEFFLWESGNICRI